MADDSFDAVIVGSGIAGALVAKQLGAAGKKVLILEAGEELPPNINEYMERFYKASAKVPEVPYPPDIIDDQAKINDPTLMSAGRPTVLTLNSGNWQDPAQSYLIQKGPLAFASTYERINGGTARHWLGTSLRFVPSDFEMQSRYGRFVDWPIGYKELDPWYAAAEAEIGVSANAQDQQYLGISFPAAYAYPMPGIPLSLVDKAVSAGIGDLSVDGIQLKVTGTPAARNSQPYQNRRVCAGNTNCIPICPIQAKYDPSVTLADALRTGNVKIRYRTVASEVHVDEHGRVESIGYIQYGKAMKASAGASAKTGEGSVSAKVFIVAANAIETPRLLLMSKNGGRTPAGVANLSGQLGKNLMDHPLYLAWAMMPEKAPVFPYRGPLSTAGIESMRDGSFRRDRGAFRVEIGNEGWNFPIGDPYTTTFDLISGTNVSGLNQDRKALVGPDLVAQLNSLLSRQFRLGFLVEQSPEEGNSVMLSDKMDGLGLPRPQITYDLSDYTKKGFVAAKKTADAVFARIGAVQYTDKPPDNDPCSFETDIDGKPTRLKFFGAGHLVGTYRMGTNRGNSVVDDDQRSWDHGNLFLIGSGVFPTVATANPTLTLAALALRTAQTIAKDLG